MDLHEQEVVVLAGKALAPGENERLEFLGDAVLELVITEELYRRRRDWTEAELAQARESVVQAKALERAGKRAGQERVFRAVSGGVGRQVQPEYRVVDEGDRGTAAEVRAGPVVARGRGRNRREGEAAAAEAALERLA